MRIKLLRTRGEQDMSIQVPVVPRMGMRAFFPSGSWLALLTLRVLLLRNLDSPVQ